MTSFRFFVPSNEMAPAIGISRKMIKGNELGFDKFRKAIGA